MSVWDWCCFPALTAYYYVIALLFVQMVLPYNANFALQNTTSSTYEQVASPHLCMMHSITRLFSIFWLSGDLPCTILALHACKQSLLQPFIAAHSPRPNPNTARMRWKICRRHPSAVDSTTSPLPKRSSCTKQKMGMVVTCAVLSGCEKITLLLLPVWSVAIGSSSLDQ